MADQSDDLRATADDLVEDARRLEAIEEAKKAMAPGDPALTALAEEAERLTRRMAAKATAQRELTAEINGEA